MNRRLVILLALAAALGSAAARAELTDPAQIQTEAYINLVQADQSLDAGRLDEALTQYQAARDYYLRLAKDFPGWEPRVIQYRKTYCDNQIADVERRQAGGLPAELPELEPEETPAAAAVPPPPPDRPVAAPAPPASVEVDYLKSRIASLESELADFEAIQDEAARLTAANEQLQKDLDEANRKLAEAAGLEQQAVAGVRAELAARDEEIAGLEKELEAKKELDQALNDMEAKVNDLRAQNERLEKEIKTLDAELDEAETRAEQAEAGRKAAEQKAEQAGEDARQRLEQAEQQAAQARQDLARLQDEKAATDEELALLKRKPLIEKPRREKPPAKTAKVDVPAPAEPAPPAEPPAEEVHAESAPLEPAVIAPVPAAGPAATAAPRPVPPGTAPADFVRQLLQDGANAEALATVQEARKSSLADVNLALIEGIALIRLQRYSEAATQLIELAKNNPRNAEAHATLGAAMMGAGFYEEAREALQMAVRLDRNLPECHYNLAQLYAFTDPIDLKQARKAYQQARDLGLAADPQLEKALK